MNEAEDILAQLDKEQADQQQKQEQQKDAEMIVSGDLINLQPSQSVDSNASHQNNQYQLQNVFEESGDKQTLLDDTEESKTDQKIIDTTGAVND